MSVAVRSGSNSSRLLEVEATSLAARVVQRPDSADVGHFGVSLASGTMAAGLGAAAEVFQFRLDTSSYVVAVRRVRIWAGNLGTAFTAGFFRFELVPARSWTADGSGGTAAVVTGNIGKKRTSMTTMANITARISSTAALTAGTKTLDTASGQGLCSVGGGIPNVAGTSFLSPGVDLLSTGDGAGHPLLLDDQEGFVIRATVPATGTWTFGVDVDFAQLTSY